MGRRLKLICLALVSQLIFGCSANNPDVPDSEHFHSFLIGDLRSYFKAKLGKDFEVTYELFRQAPTITGIAWPKYYAWVTLTSNHSLVEQGAVRLAAIQGQMFDITDFINQKQIPAQPGCISQIFPATLCDVIITKAKSTPTP